MLTVYGIPNCDTVTAARRWLEQHGVDYTFHDLRKQPLDARTLEQWLERLGRERLLNKASATWRTLERTQRAQLESGNPVPVLLAYPTLIRRPVLRDGDLLHAGFSERDFERLFAGR